MIMSITAVTTSAASRERIDECLGLQTVAAGQGIRILQICCVDHSGPLYDTPHLHIQCIFSDSSRSPWILLPTTYIADLQAAVGSLPGSVRLHIHEPEANSKTKPANTTVVGRLPKIVLCQTATSKLQQGDAACPICLVDYKVDDDIMCLPCNGLHKAHSACMKSWLDTADTCPTCRFPIPADDDPKLPDLIKRAKDELCRLQKAPESPRCIPITTKSSSFDYDLTNTVNNARRKREKAARLRSSRTQDSNAQHAALESTSTTSITTSTSTSTDASTSNVNDTGSGREESHGEGLQESAYSPTSTSHDNNTNTTRTGRGTGGTVEAVHLVAVPSRRRGWSLTGALSRRRTRKNSYQA